MYLWSIKGSRLIIICEEIKILPVEFFDSSNYNKQMQTKTCICKFQLSRDTRDVFETARTLYRSHSIECPW